MTPNENTSEPLRGELVPLEDAEAMPVGAPLTLFGTSDPDVALRRMSEIAERLIDVVRDRKLVARISGKEYLTAEAWQVVGGMVGVFPIVVETRPNETGDGYVARVEARTLDGHIVGAAEAECSSKERVWRDRYPSTLRAMAQTRAVSRALRAPLGQVVALAGYDAAAAEEMPTVIDGTAARPEPDPEARRTPAAGAEPTREQWAQVETLLRSLQSSEPDVDWKARAQEIAGVEARMLTGGGAAMLIRRLEERLAELAGGEGKGS